MGKRDERYHLTGHMELDEAFFTVELPEGENTDYSGGAAVKEKPRSSSWSKVPHL